jgi:hypothetical protein
LVPRPRQTEAAVKHTDIRADTTILHTDWDRMLLRPEFLDGLIVSWSHIDRKVGRVGDNFDIFQGKF